MRRAGLLLGVFLSAALVGHLLTITLAPRAIMAVAMARLSQGGMLVNRWQFAPRVDAALRTVVRPSPDLAYASCVYDLAQGPVLVSARTAADHGYGSIAVFAANTDNIAVFDTFAQVHGIRFVLALPGQATPTGEAVVRSPSRRGIVLDRRLAPDDAGFAAADAARRRDTCVQLNRE